MKVPLKTILEVELSVKNAAIGGVPSFPYGWCLENFLVGSDTEEDENELNAHMLDVISWDFSMNEAADVPYLMEGYIRNMINSLDSGNGPPMLLVKDTHMATRRKALIHNYYRQHLLLDPLILHTDPAVDPFLEEDESFRPFGFQEWRKFGAPPGAPGMAKHHPALKEHEFIAWVLAMHFLAAIEVVLLLQNKNIQFGEKRSNDSFMKQEFPPPIHFNESISTSMFYGAQNTEESWTMGTISCRTTFQPSTGDISDTIVSGEARDSRTIDLMLPKGRMYHSKGWVLDLGEAEKKAKKKLTRYGGLGYIDSKQAYYGTYTSGPLTLFLKSHDYDVSSSKQSEKSLNRIVICEVNEVRKPGSCNMKEDISFSVSGIEVQPQFVEGVSYLGRQICVQLEIPPQIRAVNDPRNEEASFSESSKDMGYILEVVVKNKSITKDEACSVSHIVWEMI